MFLKKKKAKYVFDKDQLRAAKQAMEQLDDEPEPPKELDEPEPTEPKKTSSLPGKYLLREMPLFKYEIIAYIMIIVGGVMMMLLGSRGMLDVATVSKVGLFLAVIPIAIWGIKWFVYMPRGNKVPSIRIFKSGVVRLGVDDISKGYVVYGKGENQKRKYITKLRRHAESSTGRPFLVTSELRGENLDLLTESKPDMRSEEFNAILETNTAVTTKNVMNKMMKFAKPGLDNPMMWISVISMFLIIVLLIKEFGILNMIKGG